MTALDIVRLACATWWTWMLLSGKFAVSAPLVYRLWYKRFPAPGTRYARIEDVPYRTVKVPHSTTPGEWIKVRRQRLAKWMPEAGAMSPQMIDGQPVFVRKEVTTFQVGGFGLSPKTEWVNTQEVAYDLAGAWEIYDEIPQPKPGPYNGEAHYLGRLLSCIQCGPVYVAPVWWLAWRMWPAGTLEVASVLSVLVGVMIVGRVTK
jgi:hypothetical protein